MSRTVVKEVSTIVGVLILLITAFMVAVTMSAYPDTKVDARKALIDERKNGVDAVRCRRAHGIPIFAASDGHTVIDCRPLP
jgi:hypothetical protein